MVPDLDLHTSQNPQSRDSAQDPRRQHPEMGNAHLRAASQPLKTVLVLDHRQKKARLIQVPDLSNLPPGRIILDPDLVLPRIQKPEMMIPAATRIPIPDRELGLIKGTEVNHSRVDLLYSSSQTPPGRY